LPLEDSEIVHEWLAALEVRHLSNLRVQEVTRALRALSMAYVQRRGPAISRSLDTVGKRAAFALFYAPLHLLTTDRVVRELGAEIKPPKSILDMGCGTGVAGAAWALACDGTSHVTGIDRHPWAIEEARWTYRQLGIAGRARAGDLLRLPPVAPGAAVIAAYVLNEVPAVTRALLESRLLDAAGRGARILIIEPIARSIAPWWDALAVQMVAAGGRANEWRFPVDLPPSLRMFDKAAGLDHRELTARSLYCPGAAA
jgi:SAM-dependent methyltransferase